MPNSNLDFLKSLVNNTSKALPTTGGHLIMKAAILEESVKFGIAGGELYAEFGGDRFVFRVPSSGDLQVDLNG